MLTIVCSVVECVALHGCLYSPLTGFLSFSSISSSFVYRYLDFYDNDNHAAYIDSATRTSEFAPGSLSGAGGMFSSTADMIQWYSTLFSADPVVLSLESVKQIMKPHMLTDTNGTYYAQGTMVQAYNKTTGWPRVVMYEGSSFGMWTAIKFAPELNITVTAFSSVAHVNVTSAAEYHAIASARTGSLSDWLAKITVGQDDGGAGSCASAIFSELVKNGTK